MNKKNFKLLDSCSIKLKVNKGNHIGPSIGGRMREWEVAFPDLNMVELTGKVEYSAAWSHALKSESGLHVQHSLGASLNPKLAENVERSWSLALSKPHNLNVVKVEGPIYIAQNEGSGTWGHWLVHNLPRVILFLRKVPNGRVVIPDDYRSERYKSCLQLLEKFDVGLDKLIFLRRSEILLAESVFLIDIPYINGSAHPVVFDLYAEIRCKKGLSNSDRTFINRTAGTRKISNFNDVDPILRRNGFNISSELGGLEDQISLWNNSKVISGVLGSDLTNMLFGDVDQLYVITPEWFGDRFFYGLAASLGIEWNELVCSNEYLSDLREPKHLSSFMVAPDLLEKFFLK